MWVSILKVNNKSKQGKIDLSHPYQMHRTLSQVFPDLKKDRILFRTQKTTKSVNGPYTICVVYSQTKPDWKLMKHEDYFFQKPSTVPMTDQYELNQYVNIKVFLKPIQRSNGKNEQYLKSNYEQMNWTRKKLKSIGLNPSAVKIKKFKIGKNMDHTDKTKLQLKGISVEALCKIKDVEKFKTAIEKGISRGKAFGYGLITVEALRGK